MIALLLAAIQPPPVRFQGDSTITVTFAKPELVQELCRQRDEPRDPRMIGCADKGSMHVPNPCGIDEHYAQIVCHELGHANGWPADHGP